jgi:glycine cleavage system aminomethyltransferase T
VRALRLSYVGELGWEIYAPTEFGLALWDLLWQAGAACGVVACGGAAYDAMRLEKGYRLWGADIDEEHDPYEAGLGWAVRLQKGPFLGRDALAEVKERGVARRLACLVLDDPAAVCVGKEPILDGEEAVGYVTSAALGASIGQSIAYGYVPVDAGPALSVWVEGERIGATVTPEPLFDPKMERLKDAAPVPA